MKKVFAFVAMMGLLTFGVNQTINAQETEAPATEEVAQDDSASVAAAEENVVEEAAPEEEEGEGLHKTIKVKFIEGSAGFMSLVAIAMIFGLALCIERIIFLCSYVSS